MSTASGAIFAQFDALRVVSAVLHGGVIALTAIATLKGDNGAYVC
jgi:hypothetical protein